MCSIVGHRPAADRVALPFFFLSSEFVCKAAADVAFIVDSSGSISRCNWVKMLRFLKYMVKAFNVGPHKTHVAVVAYSTGAKVEFRFNRLTCSAVTEEGYYDLYVGLGTREVSRILIKLCCLLTERYLQQQLE